MKLSEKTKEMKYASAKERDLLIKKLEDLRKSLNLTHIQIAKKIGITRKCLYELRSKKVSMSDLTRWRINRFLDKNQKRQS